MSTTEKSSAILTDAEIKQALECCISCGDCEDCPMQTTSEECIRNLFRESLNIINCQQAEIEMLEKQLDLKGLEYTLLERDRAKDICDFAEEFKTIKAEAFKEFAEKLCEGRVSNDPVVIAVNVELKTVGDAE